LRALDQELQLWHRHGAAPQVWWRDDDAHSDSSHLHRLCDFLATETLVLAVIPGLVTDSLVRRLDGYPEVGVIQHGWKHVNYAEPDVWPSEYPWHRDRVEVALELRKGRSLLASAFPKQFHPILTPPWNTVAGWIFLHARSLGYCALSKGAAPHPLSGQSSTREVDAEIDICDWSREAQFIGAERLATALAAALRKRRQAAAWEEPIGINSHHMQIAADDFVILRCILTLLKQAGAVWQTPSTLFADAAGS
jgi:hypothetical protein